MFACRFIRPRRQLYTFVQTRALSKRALGLVGLPNVGKSTLFNALCNRPLATVGNFPFCTIDPASTIVEIDDSRLKTLQKLESSKKMIGSGLELVDIAGLVKGAAEGKGYVNNFV
jgi:ribosome-binding ATPase YchF (GTP1/OBG family)